MRHWRLWRERAGWAVRHRGLLVECVAAALAVEGFLRWAPFTRTLAWTEAGGAPLRPSLPAAAATRRAIRFVYAVLPFPGTCLRESLILRRMCTRRGVPTVLRLGVRRAGAGLQSHAWLEDAEGRVLTDALDYATPCAPESGPITLHV